MADDRFAAHTRSASFALTLSQPMITRLLSLNQSAYLTAKYPWHRPLEVNFGTPADAVAEWTDPTMRGLLRRGLLDVHIPDAVPFLRHECFPLTKAGRILCDLLVEADFTLDAERFHPKVPPHPDDRHVLSFVEDGEAHVERSTTDRRDWETDGPWLQGGRFAKFPGAAEARRQ